MKIFVSTIVLLSITTLTYAQQKKSKIDSRDLKKFVQILSSDSLEGRATGSPGGRKAQKLIAERFKKLGLEPVDGNNYLEEFNLKEVYWNDVYLKTNNNTLYNFESMVLQGGNTENLEIRKEIVFGGWGEDSELNKINVENRLVLVFVKNLRSYSDINRKLQKRKAYGLIIANPQNTAQFESIRSTFKDHSLQKRLFIPQIDTVRGNYSAVFDTLKFLNTIIIPTSQLKSVTGLSLSNLEKLVKEKRVQEAPLAQVSVKFEKIVQDVETANVIGVIKGQTNKSIVISAHYDHLGQIGRDIFPGADDNASGTAALLELAEEFSGRELSYNIIFIATSAEEAGLLGSQHHVNQKMFNPKNILLNLNIDMISRTDEKHNSGNYLYCIGASQSPEIEKLILKADNQYTGCSFDYSLNTSGFPTGIFSRSDNYNFYKKGIPSILFFSGLHNDYHQPTDTFEKIDFKSLEKRVQLIGEIIELMQQELTFD